MTRLRRENAKRYHTRLKAKRRTSTGRTRTGKPKPWDFTRQTKRRLKALQRLSGGKLQGHHVIPQEFRSHAAIRASGFKIYGGRNFMALPVKPIHHVDRHIHRGSHDQYSARVGKQLDAIAQRGKAQRWSRAQYTRAIERVVAQQRAGLRDRRERVK